MMQAYVPSEATAFRLRGLGLAWDILLVTSAGAVAALASTWFDHVTGPNGRGGPSAAVVYGVVISATVVLGGLAYLRIRSLLERLAALDGAKARDASARQTALAYTDGLTGLSNRRHLETLCDEAIRSGASATLLLVRLSGLAGMAGRFGDADRDRVLATLGKRLRAAVDTTDTVARVAGDEFAVLTYDPLSSPLISALAPRIVTALEAPVSIERREHSFPVAIGAARLARVTSTQDLFRHAQAARDEAGSRGRSAVSLFVD